MIYPEYLHDLHNSCPLAPEKITINISDLSPRSQQIHKYLNRTEKKFDRLTATFLKRKKYCLHIKNLQLYCQLGMILVKIHRAIKFEQEKVVKEYIDTCTKQRSMSSNEFVRTLWKVI